MTITRPRMTRSLPQLALVAIALSLSSCGGGGGGGGTTRHSVGGVVSGLSGTLVLQNNGGDDLTVTRNGGFTFPTLVVQGSSYSVTVLTQPANQLCTVANGTGVASANVSNVSVTCVTRATYTIGGTIVGLNAAGLQISAGSTNVVAPASGATTFTLPDAVTGNVVYDVGVTAQPAGHTCVILNAHGVVGSTNVDDIEVRCINNVTSPLVGTYTTVVAGASTANYALTLFADGVYVFGSVSEDLACGASRGNGVEYGVYRYNAVTNAFEIRSAVIDTNGSCGLWNGTSQADGTVTLLGSGTNTLLTLTTAAGTFQYLPADSTAGSLVGSWPDPYQRGFTTFVNAAGTNVYTLSAWTQRSPAGHDDGYRPGIETSCGSVTAYGSGDLTMDPTSVFCTTLVPGIPPPVDTNGDAGLSAFGTVPIPFSVDVDELTFAGATYQRLVPP